MLTHSQLLALKHWNTLTIYNDWGKITLHVCRANPFMLISTTF